MLQPEAAAAWPCRVAATASKLARSSSQRSATESDLQEAVWWRMDDDLFAVFEFISRLSKVYWNNKTLDRRVGVTIRRCSRASHDQVRPSQALPRSCFRESSSRKRSSVFTHEHTRHLLLHRERGNKLAKVYCSSTSPVVPEPDTPTHKLYFTAL